MLVANVDVGGLILPLDDGRCCHDRVPERARLVALGEGFDADSNVSDAIAGL